MKAKLPFTIAIRYKMHLQEAQRVFIMSNIWCILLQFHAIILIVDILTGPAEGLCNWTGNST